MQKFSVVIMIIYIYMYVYQLFVIISAFQSFISFIHFLHRVVKEEIVDDDAKLPCFNGRVVSWVS